MSKFLIIVVCAFSFNAFCQTPDYFANNPTWHCGEWNSDQWDSESDPYTDNYIYYLNGDTTTLGFTYHKVFKKGTRDYDFVPGTYNGYYNYQTDYFIRQEGKSIRFFTSQNNVDLLLVSYDYVVGDTVKGDVFGFNQDTIQKIDSILINSEYRKVFYLDTISGPVITEGIGHQMDVNGSFGEFLIELVEGIGFDYYIHCYGQNEIPLWDSYGNGGDCYLNVGVDENAELEFQLFPNPASNYVSIVVNKNELLFVKIYDINGRLLLETSDNQISLENFERGTYFIIISDPQGNILREKLIVN